MQTQRPLQCKLEVVFRLCLLAADAMSISLCAGRLSSRFSSPAQVQRAGRSGGIFSSSMTITPAAQREDIWRKCNTASPESDALP